MPGHYHGPTVSRLQTLQQYLRRQPRPHDLSGGGNRLPSSYVPYTGQAYTMELGPLSPGTVSQMARQTDDDNTTHVPEGPLSPGTAAQTARRQHDKNTTHVPEAELDGRQGRGRGRGGGRARGARKRSTSASAAAAAAHVEMVDSSQDAERAPDQAYYDQMIPDDGQQGEPAAASCSIIRDVVAVADECDAEHLMSDVRSNCNLIETWSAMLLSIAAEVPERNQEYRDFREELESLSLEYACASNHLQHMLDSRIMGAGGLTRSDLTSLVCDGRLMSSRLGLRYTEMKVVADTYVPNKPTAEFERLPSIPTDSESGNTSEHEQELKRRRRARQRRDSTKVSEKKLFSTLGRQTSKESLTEAEDEKPPKLKRRFVGKQTPISQLKFHNDSVGDTADAPSPTL